MVEEYMEGPEVSVETLSVNGVCHVIQITDKLTTDAPYFVEMGHSQPSGHTEEIKKQIAEVAIAAESRNWYFKWTIPYRNQNNEGWT